MTADEKHSAERRTKIGRVYEAALERAPGDRSAFVADACAGDEDVRREVESLLAYADDTERFIERPAAEIVAKQIWAGHTAMPGSSTALVGHQFGVYRIVSRLGAGGMGEVYQARDTRLERDVAIKVLPTIFARDPERLHRLEREARLLASLNHTRIGAIYGLEEREGVSALILELIEGPTLAERLARGSLPVDQALRLACQIAEALEAAHEKGIVHRDLKPANIKVTPGGVKVLDFGIAKAAAVDGADDVSSDAVRTRAGMILGTAAYMSPEQACGEAVDKRADVWAFGAVLYEMLTGRAAFARETVAGTVTAILNDQPDWTRLPAALPASVQRLLRRCLERDPRRRLHDIADARLELEDAFATPAAAGTLAARSHASIRWVPWAVAALAVVIAAALVLRTMRAPVSVSTNASMGRFSEWLPGGALLAPAPALGISPDGRRIVYVAIRDGRRALYMRDLAEPAARPLSGTGGADQPFFSPDGRWIGFFADGVIKKIAVAGGTPITVTPAPAPRGGAWAPDNSIIFAPSTVSPLMRVSADGGAPEPVTTLDRTANEASHRWPSITPDGATLLYAAGPTVSAFGWNEAHIVAQSLRTGQRRIVAPHGTFPQFLDGGTLLYGHDRVVYAQGFDASRLAVSGEGIPVLTPIDQMGGINGGAFEIAVSPGGTLLHGLTAVRPQQSFVWVDRMGQIEPLAISPGWYSGGPRLSPDGRHVAYTVHDASDSDVWVYDLERGTSRRVTFGGRNLWPTWSADGLSLTYASSRDGSTNVYSRRVDGSGAEEQLTRTPYTYFPQSWSRDGALLSLSEVTDKGAGITVLSRTDPSRLESFYRGSGGSQGALSPDGRWLAHVATESGRNEVYVRPFPGPGPARQISTAGGDDPVWARSGNEIFFRRGDTWMVVEITVVGNTLSSGTPEMLFRGSYATGGVRPGYDVSPDGKRFLMTKISGEGPELSRFNIVLNWRNEVSDRMSSANR